MTGRDRAEPTTKLQTLWQELGQSPWLDNLTRDQIRDGTLRLMMARGIRGVTANPTIFARAIEGSVEYDEQFRALIGAGKSVNAAYWDLVVDDVEHASSVLRPTFVASKGSDGFVSIEIDPDLAHDTAATVQAARDLHERIAAPNVFVKIPATAEGIPAIRAMTAEGRNINVTLIYSLARYAEVIDAYVSGLEALLAAGGDASVVRGVASFFVSRVDTEVDRRLDAIGTDRAKELRGKAAIAQAKLAYQMFRDRFRGERWDALEVGGARRQRPLWASTSTKDPAYRDTVYVESLIGPETVNTLPEATIGAFEDHGVLARTVDTHVEGAHAVMRDLAEVGVDIDAVGLTLEQEGIVSFQESFRGVLASLDAKARRLAIG